MSNSAEPFAGPTALEATASEATAVEAPATGTWAAVLLGSLCIALVSGLAGLLQGPAVPDFSARPAGPERKAAFLSYFGAVVDAENARWAAERKQIEGFAAPLSPRVRERLEKRAAFFGLPEGLTDDALLSGLLLHVDRVPRSLALAQAAKESAWGTSRFAVEGHNYFGQRCYQKGCGMVPAARAPGAKFEVRRFRSPAASVASYFNNINGHREYAALRDYRAGQRAAGLTLSGIRAAERITQYSERRQAYVDEIQSLIHFNDLEGPNPLASEGPKP
ncbi:MAG: glucosaminidase domain-containing protein [Pseudomonadota bacterium]